MTTVLDVPGVVQQDGTYLFDVTAEQVGQIFARTAYLFLTTRHVLQVGSADLRWGWRYKLIQGAANLTAADGDGNPLALDGQGFFNSPLQAFDGPVELSRETIVLK